MKFRDSSGIDALFVSAPASSKLKDLITEVPAPAPALTASDGFQLAAAATWAEGRTQAEFVCLDRRLRAAARAEDLVVLPH